MIFSMQLSQLCIFLPLGRQGEVCKKKKKKKRKEKKRKERGEKFNLFQSNEFDLFFPPQLNNIFMRVLQLFTGYFRHYCGIQLVFAGNDDDQHAQNVSLSMILPMQLSQTRNGVVHFDARIDGCLVRFVWLPRRNLIIKFQPLNQVMWISS